MSSTEANVQPSFDELMMGEIARNFYRCNDTVLHQPYPKDGGLYCNATFDGYDCWNYTRAGSRAYGVCLKFMEYQFGKTIGLPFKDCNSDGTWFRHPETGHPWTNYNPCTETEKTRKVLYVLYVYFAGYSLSIVSLTLSLGIFLYFRQLRCTRVTIHKNMFFSYIITAVLWIVYYATSAFDPRIILQNPVWCKILHVVAQYVTMCNYAWMLCEGFYLHTILVWTFTSESTLLLICYAIGWALPMIPTAIYVGYRAADQSTDKGCWHEDTYYKWIFTGPVTVSLIINFVFLLNVLRILCSKVRSLNRQDSNPVRQTVRATLILIPLLGIQCFLVPNRPDNSEEHQLFAYDIASATLSSFQGFLVALLFCFLNGEVIYLLKSQCKRMKRRMSRTDTGRSVVYSAVQQGQRRKSLQANPKVYSNESIPIRESSNDHDTRKTSRKSTHSTEKIERKSDSDTGKLENMSSPV